MTRMAPRSRGPSWRVPQERAGRNRGRVGKATATRGTGANERPSRTARRRANGVPGGSDAAPSGMTLTRGRSHNRVMGRFPVDQRGLSS